MLRVCPERNSMYMCVLGLCVYVRVGRPGRPGTRPTGEDPSGISAGMRQVSMSPKSSILPTSPLLLRSLLLLSHRIGIVRRFILQTKRMSLCFTHSKYINVDSNASCFPYLQTRVHTQGQTAEQLQRRRAWASFATGHSMCARVYH